MTVKDLIAKLSELPPEAVVYLTDWQETYLPPGRLSSVELDRFNDEDRIILDAEYKSDDWKEKK
jgi:hypothetical protein